MKCLNCGLELKNEEMFCPVCGAKNEPYAIDNKKSSEGYGFIISLILLGTSITVFVILLLKYLGII